MSSKKFLDCQKHYLFIDIDDDIIISTVKPEISDDGFIISTNIDSDYCILDSEILDYLNIHIPEKGTWAEIEMPLSIKIFKIKRLVKIKKTPINKNPFIEQ